MKKFELLKWIIALIVLINFSACINEPLEGEFPQNEDIINIDEGGFRADIGFNRFTARCCSWNIKYFQYFNHNRFHN